MGKVLIIKGADFSEVAVAHEIVAPTVYYPVNDHIGSAGKDSYQEGDYYFRCQHGLSDQDSRVAGGGAGLFIKQNGESLRPSNLMAGDFVKIGGAYYTIEESANLGNQIAPYFGVKAVNLIFTNGTSYKYVDSSTIPNDYTSTLLKSCQISLVAGKTYVIFGFGSGNNYYTVAIVKKSNNSYVNLGDGQDINFIEYTAELGDVLYFSTNKIFISFIAEVVP